jgi:hypothetical protein
METMTVLALALLLLQAGPGAADVVVLKDGTTRSGRIVSEDAQEVILESFIKGAKGQVVGTARVTLQRSAIDRIERVSGEAKRQAEERAKAFSERGVRRAQALANVHAVPAKFEGREGYEVVGTHYVLKATGDLTFVKDVAVCLDEIFAAYRRFFDVRRNEFRKVKVFVFSDRIEYDLYNLARHGGTVAAVAYYHVSENTIAAYNLIEKEKEKLIRDETLDAQKDLERFRSEAQAVERRVVELVKEIRQRIQDEAVELRRQIRSDGQGGKDQRIQEIDRREKQAMDELRDGKAEVQKELQDARRKANAAIEKCSQVIERNEKVLAGQNSLMFETLFHEGFHAFASNHLWEGSDQKEFPRWLHEGMACYFERSVVESGMLIHGASHPEFLKMLKERIVLKTVLPVEKILRGGADMFTLTHPKQAERRTLYYAQSWALVHYLSSRATSKQIETFVNEVLSGKDAVESFERLTGKKVRQVDDELRAHLESLN